MLYNGHDGLTWHVLLPFLLGDSERGGATWQHQLRPNKARHDSDTALQQLQQHEEEAE